MIVTALTEMFGLKHPIVLGPMGGVAGGLLAAAVSNGGGLGMVGGGYGEKAWLETELALVKANTDRPWGAGLITWSIGEGVLELVLAAKPHAVALSFGDPTPYASAIKAAGCKLICQVQDVAGAVQARKAGADLIVAQGTEGGGHGGSRATLPLVPAVIDAVGSVPVVAAGGIADGRGLAAAIMLGAQGVLMGTRFYATPEALGHDQAKQRIVNACGDQTQRTRVFDIVRGYDWPNGYTGRALHNPFMRRWDGKEEELAKEIAVERPAFWEAAGRGDYETAMVWAGEVSDLIHTVEGAGDLVGRISAQAEAQLRIADKVLRP